MVISFYKYNRYFLCLPQDVAACPTIHAEGSVRGAVPLGRIFPATVLLEQLGIRVPAGSKELIAIEDSPLIVVGSASDFASRTLTGYRLNEDKLKLAAWSHFHKWKTDLDRQIIDTLLQKPQSLKDPASVCARYSHSDAYSLWIYNPHTSVFTCAASTYEYQKTFLTQKENSSLFAFLDSKKAYESRNPTPELCPHPALAECKTLNRIRIELEHSNTIAILNLYSRHPDFTIPGEISERVSEIIRTKYGESRFDLHKNYEQIEHFFTTDYSPGKLADFLGKLTEQVSAHLNFEACSVFLRDLIPTRMKLTATFDVTHLGSPSETVYYPIDETSLTGLVAFSGKPQFSYDLSKDPRNSNRYGEKTSLPGTNWIGVPILIDKRAMGVVRVKNKISSKGDIKELRNIRPADIEYLESIATMLASVLQIENLYVKSREDLDQARKTIEELNDFNTVFLHEIKTPISTFSLAPGAIKRSLRSVRDIFCLSRVNWISLLAPACSLQRQIN